MGAIKVEGSLRAVMGMCIIARGMLKGESGEGGEQRRQKVAWCGVVWRGSRIR